MVAGDLLRERRFCLGQCRVTAATRFGGQVMQEKGRCVLGMLIFQASPKEEEKKKGGEKKPGVLEMKLR